MINLHLGDCLDVLKRLPAGSVDAVVTDPPAGIGFMGRDWDGDRGGRSEWVGWLSSVLAECLRVARPGAVLLCWALPRTSYWTGAAIEDAGWSIEDRLAHVFGQGFPKHRSKLKPAVEDWWLARKPGPKWLGVDACRIEGVPPSVPQPVFDSPTGLVYGMKMGVGRNGDMSHASGRWPANLCLSHSPSCNGTCAEDCPIRLMGEQGGILKSGKAALGGHKRRTTRDEGIFGGGKGSFRTPGDAGELHGDSGTAARFFANFDAEADPFFYCPKASRKDRGAGNAHPTVKPVALMRWLCRLACPPGGTILDPFMGSGSTGAAAIAEGMGFVGIEREAEYHAIASSRIAEAQSETPLFAGAAL